MGASIASPVRPSTNGLAAPGQLQLRSSSSHAGHSTSKRSRPSTADVGRKPAACALMVRPGGLFSSSLPRVLRPRRHRRLEGPCLPSATSWSRGSDRFMRGTQRVDTRSTEYRLPDTACLQRQDLGDHRHYTVAVASLSVDQATLLGGVDAHHLPLRVWFRPGSPRRKRTVQHDASVARRYP